MGSSSSVALRPEEVADLMEESGFAQKTVLYLWKRYSKLDRSKSGLVSAKDLMMIPELCMNPLASRFVCLFRSGDPADSTHEDASERMLNFREFLGTLKVFAPHMRHSDERYRLLFAIFDYDGDGTLSSEDLTKSVRTMTKGACSDAQVREIVDRTLASCKQPGDGNSSGITFPQFVESCKGLPLDSLLTISFGEGDEDDDEDDATAVRDAASAAAAKRASRPASEQS